MIKVFGPASYRMKRCGTAMAMAILERCSDFVIELLLEYGADANASDDEFSSILQLAVSQNHVRTVELLLTRGADVKQGGQVR